jgi:hypothetical protein
MKLDRCSGCGGFVPASHETCPHCSAGRSKVIRAVACVIGAGAISMTLMACYGGPPCPEGQNCHPSTPSPDTSSVPALAPDSGK